MKTVVPSPASAWVVGFVNGVTLANDKTNGNFVRLVRGGQSVDSFDLLGSPAVASGPIATPTLDEWMLALLVLVLLGFGVRRARRSH